MDPRTFKCDPNKLKDPLTVQIFFFLDFTIDTFSYIEKIDPEMIITLHD